MTASGRAVAPASAPAEVKAVIAAANRIATKPYIWGGGHRRWWDRGYDCSGAVSYVLHKGGFLTSPLDSTGLERWGYPGAGQWITVYSNRGHAYAVIAGLRWDTAGDETGTGPRWHPTLGPAASGTFKVRLTTATIQTLMATFSRLLIPAFPTHKVFCPMASKIGATCSRASSGPEASTTSLPSAAGFLVPSTGASTNVTPALSAAAIERSVASCPIVLICSQTAPSRAAGNT